MDPKFNSHRYPPFIVIVVPVHCIDADIGPQLAHSHSLRLILNRRGTKVGDNGKIFFGHFLPYFSSNYRLPKKKSVMDKNLAWTHFSHIRIYRRKEKFTGEDFFASRDAGRRGISAEDNLPCSIMPKNVIAGRPVSLTATESIMNRLKKGAAR